MLMSDWDWAGWHFLLLRCLHAMFVPVPCDTLRHTNRLGGVLVEPTRRCKRRCAIAICQLILPQECSCASAWIHIFFCTCTSFLAHDAPGSGRQPNTLPTPGCAVVWGVQWLGCVAQALEGNSSGRDIPGVATWPHTLSLDMHWRRFWQRSHSPALTLCACHP